ncbi:MAG: 4-hydroxybenzoate 3-monooxygenase [Methyloligellaceae bacterium]
MNSRTQVAIIGGGPAGLLLSHILDQNNIDNIVLEKQTKEYVLSRIRAGVLEAGSMQLLRDVGLGDNMDRDGKAKDGTAIVWENKDSFFIDTRKWVGKPMMAYGQTAITTDLYAARERDGGNIVNEAGGVELHDLTSDNPRVTYQKSGEKHEVVCDYIAGCDGFHGVSRNSIPGDVLKTYERVYPFGWLGIMTEVPPLENFVYAYHSRGFALAAQRNPMLSRYYVQCDITDSPEDWPDDRFWDELMARFPDEIARDITTGPSIEKSVAPLRSFVAEPLRYGKMFLAGDSAHIVPPTGAKGLNLAFSDVYYLSRAFIDKIKNNNDQYIESYSEMALRRVWSASNLSWRLTKLLHVFPGEEEFDQKIRQNDYDVLLQSEAAQQSLAYEYIGLPYEE